MALTLWALRARGLFAGVGAYAGACAPDNFALLHGADFTFFLTHLEQIGRPHLVPCDEGLRRFQRGVGGGGIGKNLALRKIQHPAAVLPIEDIALSEGVGREHLRTGYGWVRHGRVVPCWGGEIKTLTE